MAIGVRSRIELKIALCSFIATLRKWNKYRHTCWPKWVSTKKNRRRPREDESPGCLSRLPDRYQSTRYDSHDVCLDRSDGDLPGEEGANPSDDGKGSGATGGI
jgi:hypothetical protein